MGEKSGLIFHIIHGSFVDGHGIRTTVFLKGCPLRCRWCCNPEGQQSYPEIKFTVSACNGCGKCIEICPTRAIRLNAQSKDRKIEIRRELCTNCLLCLSVCYTGALERFGEYITVNELFNIVKKDEVFYRSQSGGVTIGGGEPTFQSDFTSALIRKCQENYIHVALDTCGYVVNDAGFKLLEQADLLLYDLKGFDSAAHLRNTGVSNELILENLKKLDARRKEIIIRIPLVPGLTDSAAEIHAMAKFLATLKSVRRVDLLGYHEYGKIKYEQLGREYPLQLQLYLDEQLNEIKETFVRYGLNVQLGG